MSSYEHLEARGYRDMAMTDPVPHVMYQAATDKLTLEIRENLALRAEVIALGAEVARLNGELANVFKASSPEQAAAASWRSAAASMFAKARECSEGGCQSDVRCAFGTPCALLGREAV